MTEFDLFTEIILEFFGKDYKIDPNIVYVICDIREEQSGIPKIIENCSDDAVVIMKKLDAGDYLVSSRCGIERKTGSDFRGSVFAGSDATNIFEELTRLMESVNNPILIVEDKESMFKTEDWAPGHRNKIYSSMMGARLSIETKMGIPIKDTLNKTETAAMIFEIAKYQQRQTDFSGLSRSSPRKRTLFQKQEFLIQGLVNVGSKKSKELMTEFKTPANLFKWIKHCEIVYTKTGNPKDYESDTHIPGIGYKFIIENKKLLGYKN